MQDIVAAVMTISVIDLLEIVYIKECDPTVFGTSGFHLIQYGKKVIAVVQPCKVIN